MRYFIASFLLVISGLTGILLNILLYSFDGLMLFASIPFSIWAGIQLIKVFKRYIFDDHEIETPVFRDVLVIFIVCMITHLFLDTCTTYGTGLFEPFSNHRFALNNISVADIFFTIPACIILVLTCTLPNSFLNAKVNMIWMSIYFVCKFCNFNRMQGIFENAFKEQKIEVSKSMISPSILNNFLWYVVAETDTGFVSAQYSLFDNSSKITKFQFLPKSYNLLPLDAESKDLSTLHSFSQGFYNLCQDKDGNVQWNDLRFGIMGDKIEHPDDYVFKFKLKKQDEVWKGFESREMRRSISDIWPQYWSRVWGI
jgi:inner membrane protein